MIRIVLLLAALALPGSAIAQGTTQDDVLSAQILPGWRMADGRHMAALKLRLAPQWKTYWRSPGASGIPPMFDFSGSQNVGSVKVHWPKPELLHINDDISIGYYEQVVLPFEVTLDDPDATARMQLHVDLGVCRDICMPATLDLSSVLENPGAADPVIDAALQDRPISGSAAGATGVSCTVEPIADGLRLTANLTLARQKGEEFVVIEPGDPTIWVAQPTTLRAGGQLTATTDLVAPTGAPFALDRSTLLVTVLAENSAVEIRGCPAP